MAEALGCTADELSQRITEREISERLALGKPLWPRRLELMLAQLTAVLTQVHGGQYTMTDFDLFRAPERTAAPPLAANDGAEALSAMAGGVGVRVLGKKRRQRETMKEPAHGHQPR